MSAATNRLADRIRRETTAIGMTGTDADAAAGAGFVMCTGWRDEDDMQTKGKAE